MNRFKCPACGGNQYTAADTAEGCIYCGHQGELEKMLEMEPENRRTVGRLLDGRTWDEIPTPQIE